ncbi:MAG: AbrB/MazE/SpoVT family DNA-binding domain-containing protein [Deltaproteobacteria bacterium]|jgi:antitoxin PrlF
MLAKVTSKGQVTIPNEIRKKLGIGKDDRVDFILEEGRAVLVPVKTLKDLRGAVETRGEGEFAKERAQAKAALAARVRKEME